MTDEKKIDMPIRLGFRTSEDGVWWRCFILTDNPEQEPIMLAGIQFTIIDKHEHIREMFMAMMQETLMAFFREHFPDLAEQITMDKRKPKDDPSPEVHLSKRS